MTANLAKPTPAQAAPKGSRRIASLAACLALSVALAGCLQSSGAGSPNRYTWGGSDKIEMTSGDAQAANKGIHAIDPWPPSAFDRHRSWDGQRAENTYREYAGTAGEADKPANEGPAKPAATR